MRERADANRTREAGHLDEIQGVVANTLKLHRQGAVGFIVWLDNVSDFIDNFSGCVQVVRVNEELNSINSGSDGVWITP